MEANRLKPVLLSEGHTVVVIRVKSKSPKSGNAERDLIGAGPCDWFSGG